MTRFIRYNALSILLVAGFLILRSTFVIDRAPAYNEEFLKSAAKIAEYVCEYQKKCGPHASVFSAMVTAPCAKCVSDESCRNLAEAFQQPKEGAIGSRDLWGGEIQVLSAADGNFLMSLGSDKRIGGDGVAADQFSSFACGVLK